MSKQMRVVIDSFLNGATEGSYSTQTRSGLVTVFPVIIKDDKLYSFGGHYLLAQRIEIGDSHNCGYQYVVNTSEENRGGSQMTNKQRRYCLDVLPNCFELEGGDYGEEALKVLVQKLHDEILETEAKYNKFKNKQGVRALATMEKLREQKIHKGTVLSFKDSIYGGNTVKYIEYVEEMGGKSGCLAHR